MNSGPEQLSAKAARPYQSERRARAASETRAAILAAAMRLFLSRGYGGVTVADIAREAGVAVPTVYASASGKSAILAALIDEQMRDPAGAAALSAVGERQNPRDVVQVTVHGVRVNNERYHDMIQVMIAAGTLDETASDTLAMSDRRVRRALARTAQRLRDLHALRPGMSPGKATDVLWFYLGHQAWHVLVADRQWSWDEAEEWLADQASAALLDPGT
ncbi:MAG: TetR/AcrR family transcriptional regulator [Nocardiopsaceae bacterium]|jgi:AcrR family transcriptional regulator|nr:TetR/AcrR family transcriptional regulator [Nocardiopsaceae bacterium]